MKRILVEDQNTPAAGCWNGCVLSIPLFLLIGALAYVGFKFGAEYALTIVFVIILVMAAILHRPHQPEQLPPQVVARAGKR